VDNTEKSSSIKDSHERQADGQQSVLGTSYLCDRNENFSLMGDPSSFPFDHYFVNLLFIFPLKNIKLDYTTFFDKSVNSSWSPTYTNSSFAIDKFMNQYGNIGSSQSCQAKQTRLCYLAFESNTNSSKAKAYLSYWTFLNACTPLFVPTVADSLLSLIVFATIATVSSVNGPIWTTLDKKDAKSILIFFNKLKLNSCSFIFML
jgi:hypothetical protein